MSILSVDLFELLFSLNRGLASAIAILAFSLLVYILTYNLRNSVARSFSALIACVCLTYAADVALFETTIPADTITWLKVQWVGIAFTPAAYLHFSTSLLRTTNHYSALRRWAARFGYAVGLALIPLAFWTDLLVYDGINTRGISQFRAGPLFWVFAAYFLATVLWGASNTNEARHRALTATSKRRMTYLAVSFAAPALGVFPYLLLASSPLLTNRSQLALFALLFVGNLGVAVMIAIMAYSVAYFGVLTPDRVVRHNFIHFLLRGPMVAIAVIFVVMAMPEAPYVLGLPRDMVLVTLVVMTIVLGQIAISIVRPALDLLVFRRDREEIIWIQELDRRLLTTTDLQQALENILAALCEGLRIDTGFIANVRAHSGPRLEAQFGPPEVVDQALSTLDAERMISFVRDDSHLRGLFLEENGFWVTPLSSRSRKTVLGILVLKIPTVLPQLTSVQRDIVATLIDQAELALEDRALQQEVFSVLRRIIPEIERVQRVRGAVQYAGRHDLSEMLRASPIDSPDFPKMVRDALTHYWGGPQLSNSPLIELNVVQEAMVEHDHNAVRALRAVLGEAIENLRPDGERRMTTAEWLLYNILELKFIQGLRVRDIAGRLAMSESDLYRKQRVAIDQVATELAEMENKIDEEREDLLGGLEESGQALTHTDDNKP
jgi:hypothetical protein